MTVIGWSRVPIDGYAVDIWSILLSNIELKISTTFGIRYQTIFSSSELVLVFKWILISSSGLQGKRTYKSRNAVHFIVSVWSYGFHDFIHNAFTWRVLSKIAFQARFKNDCLQSCTWRNNGWWFLFEFSGGYGVATGGPLAWGLCYNKEESPSQFYCDDYYKYTYPCAPGASYHGRGALPLYWYKTTHFKSISNSIFLFLMQISFWIFFFPFFKQAID